MDLPLITGLDAGLLTFVFGVLGARIGPKRLKLDISMHDGGDKQLGLEIRRYANFAGTFRSRCC